jgi:cobalt-zinc-cadmium efflux system outer membrane protein
MPPTFSTGLMRFPYNMMMLKEKNDPMNQAGIAFSIEQMIPNQSKLNAKKNYLSSLSEIEKSKSDWTKNELRKEAKILYYNRFVNERKQIIITESEEILIYCLLPQKLNSAAINRNCKPFSKQKRSWQN